MQTFYQITVIDDDLIVRIASDPEGEAGTLIRFETNLFVAALMKALDPDIAMMPNGEIDIAFDAISQDAIDAGQPLDTIGPVTIDDLAHEMVTCLDGELDDADLAALRSCRDRLARADAEIERFLAKR